MELILLGIYSFFVWLIFIKLQAAAVDDPVEDRGRDLSRGGAWRRCCCC